MAKKGSTKTIILILLSCIAVIIVMIATGAVAGASYFESLFTPQAPDQSQIGKWQTYTNANQGFTIDYPVAEFSAVDTTNTQPTIFNSTKTRTILNIGLSQIPSGIDPNNTDIEELFPQVPDKKIVETGGEKTVQRVDDETSMSKFGSYKIDNMFFHNGKLYSIQFSFPAEPTEEQLATVAKILASFKFTQ